MISTKATLLHMPKKLQAFKKYIEGYMCSYTVENGMHTVTFYRETDDDSYTPYLLLVCEKEDYFVSVYVNKGAEKTSGDYKSNIQVENISNDMNKFIEAIRKCVKEEKNA